MNEENEIIEPEILLVEDNANDAKLTFRSIEKCCPDVKTFWVNDGELALDYLFCRGRFSGKSTVVKPKVLLLDLGLPKISGIEVLEEVRRNDRTQHIRVIILTGSDSETDKERTRSLGVDAYLAKPIKQSNFLQSLRDIELDWYFTGKK